MRRNRNSSILFILLLVLVSSCRQEKKELPRDLELATAWADITNHIAKTTPANSPTFASRCLGYIGLTMYESVVNGSEAYQSIADQLNGLGSLKKPEAGLKYNWQLSLNAGQAEIIRSIYIQTSDKNKAKIDSLENHFENLLKTKDEDSSISNRSILYGRKIAQQIFEWSKTDGGHRAYLKNFDKTRVFVEKPGCWRPPLYAQSISHYPLHPDWGKNRTFLVADSMITDPKFISFDTTAGSPYYNQFMEVYRKEKTLTQEEKECALWWGDDPDETFTPPGHSYYLATIALRKTQPDLVRCAETYARVGIAVADAFRNCWKWKYQFFSERPNTFIPQHIDREWASFWPDPPFPAFPSGHAIQASAAGHVLTDLFGENFSFVDSAHFGRKRDELRNTDFKVRKFNSFLEVADETARSRFYGGIHTPQDNAQGLEKGKEIANNINKLQWKKNKSQALNQ